MAIKDNYLINNFVGDHPPHDHAPAGRDFFTIPLGYERWFTYPAVRPVMPTPPKPVVVAVPEEPDPWSAWAAGISELFSTLAPVVVGLLAVMFLASLGE